MELSQDQQDAFDQIMQWHKDGTTPFLTFGGFAGTGKTTILSFIRNFLGENLRIGFVGYTGKCVSVLRKKLTEKNIFLRFKDDFCGTIHSLIYNPVIDEDSQEILEWQLKSSIDVDLLICDESSMVSKDIYDDLLSFEKPILWCGDHFQLPPVGDEFNLMENPNVKLETIHRQSESNPIIKLSKIIRETGYLDYGYYGDSIAKVHKKDPLITEFIKNSGNFLDTVILCGFNKTRTKINSKIRNYFGYSKKSIFPVQGERVICLRNNKSATFVPIYNGCCGTVKDCKDNVKYLNMEINIDGETDYYKGIVSPSAFGNEKPEMTDCPVTIKKNYKLPALRENKKKELIYPDYFDFGYCITTHKSQGSEWNRVMVIEEPCQYWSGLNWNRWLYTAVTRSQKQLLIVR